MVLTRRTKGSEGELVVDVILDCNCLGFLFSGDRGTTK